MSLLDHGDKLSNMQGSWSLYCYWQQHVWTAQTRETLNLRADYARKWDAVEMEGKFRERKSRRHRRV